MKILVLNGSPKGDDSVTMMHARFLEKALPQHTFAWQHVAQRIKRLESSPEAFDDVIFDVRAADIVLWATPVYYFTVPSQYKRFIELVHERGVQDAFAGRYAGVLTTSIHFFDHTSNNYLQAVCEDLGMKVAAGFPAHMQEMLNAPGRTRLQQFGEHLVQASERGAPVQRQFAPLQHHTIAYRPGAAPGVLDAGGRRVLVLHDAQPTDSNLLNMLARFQAAFAHPIEVINLRAVDIKGGCLGCLQCGYDNRCSYGDSDDFTRFYDEVVRQADLLVCAGRMHDRHLSSLWKMFLDRSFFRGHAPSLIGKQMAYIISGPLSQNGNLQEVLQAYTQMQRCNLVGMVSDEAASGAELDALLQRLAEDMVQYAAQGFFRPDNFLFVGGKKIFRDDIFGSLRAVFQADFRVYRQLRYFDFPTRRWTERLMNTAAGLAFRIPTIRNGFQRMVKPGMIQGHRKVLEKE